MELSMSYKDIVVYADANKSAAARFDVAASLAAAHGAHLTAVHVSVPPYVPMDGGVAMPAALIEWQEEFQRQQTEAAKQAVEAARRRTGAAIEWRAARGDMAAIMQLQARYADLAVVSQTGAEEDEPQDADILPEALAMGSGRPVLIVPRFGKFAKVGERVLVAWNRTREAARAVHDALPLLIKAKSVTVMEVNPKHGETPHIAGADIALHLARHGAKAEVSSAVAGDIEVGDMILARAADLSADLLVMGAYGHSRLREFALGGATRQALGSMTLPVLMSH
jgi:nucleotide-binding universal stress UspA family protein